MQKRYLLMITLALISLLLTGCLGGTSTKYVYDGSPTALEVVIKRDAVEPAGLPALSDEPEQFVQVRLWMGNDAGETIYQTSQAVPLRDITAEGYTMARQVPADKGYSVLAIYSDKHERLATRWAVDLMVDTYTFLECLKSAMDKQELADYFNVLPEFVDLKGEFLKDSSEYETVVAELKASYNIYF